MPGEPTFRELKEKEESPLLRMEAGRERRGSVYLLYQVALKKAIEEVGEQPDDRAIYFVVFMFVVAVTR